MKEPRSQASSARQPAVGAVQCAPFGPRLARFAGRAVRTVRPAPSRRPARAPRSVLPRYGPPAVLPGCRSGHRTLEVVVMKSLKDLERKLAYSVLARDDGRARAGRGLRGAGDLDRVPGRRTRRSTRCRSTRSRDGLTMAVRTSATATVMPAGRSVTLARGRPHIDAGQPRPGQCLSPGVLPQAAGARTSRRRPS